MHVAFAIVGPHRSDCRCFGNFVMLEWIEIVFDIHRGALLDRTRTEKGIRCRRDRVLGFWRDGSGSRTRAGIW
jgi:hypothetical protein